jgi:hypothetical protein
VVWGPECYCLDQGFVVGIEGGLGAVFLAASHAVERVAVHHTELEQSAVVERMFVPLVALVAIGRLPADIADIVADALVQAAVLVVLEELDCIVEVEWEPEVGPEAGLEPAVVECGLVGELHD